MHTSVVSGQTCVLREAGAVAVALGDGDAVLRADCAPVRGQSPGGRGGLALGQGPLAGVAVSDAVRRLDAFPGNWVWWETHDWPINQSINHILDIWLVTAI